MLLKVAKQSFVIKRLLKYLRFFLSSFTLHMPGAVILCLDAVGCGNVCAWVSMRFQ